MNHRVDEIAAALEEERRPRAPAILIALLLHALALFVAIDPASDSDIPQAVGSSAPRLASYIPAPPPPQARPERVQQRVKDFAPVPDPDPEVDEPVIEETLPELALLEADPLLGQHSRPSPIYGGPAGTGGDEPIELGEGVDPPTPIPPQPKPPYPDAARVQRAHGLVILLAVVTRKGDVDHIQVMREQPPGLGFAESAVRTVRNEWKFIPAKRDGEPVSVKMTITVNFSLSQL